MCRIDWACALLEREDLPLEYDLSCVPMKGDINIFYQPSADKVQLEKAVLNIIKRNGLQTKSQSWAVYVDNRPKSETTVTGAVVGDWTEQNIDTVTVNSILIYSGIAVFSCLAVFILGVFFYNRRRRARIKKEAEEFEEFQSKRKEEKEARRERRVATANKELSDQYKTEVVEAREEESLASEIGCEVEPCKFGTGTVIHLVASNLNTTELLGASPCGALTGTCTGAYLMQKQMN